MHIRPITREDLSRIIDIADAAFIDNEATQYLHPDRHKYREDWRRTCLDSTKRRFVTNSLGFVCVDAPATNGEKEVILGYAWWRRVGITEPSPFNEHNRSFDAAIERTLLRIEAVYASYFRPNKAMNHERLAQWNAWNAADDGLAPLMGKPHWWLNSIAVWPEAQKRGVGSMLVQWGKEQSETDAKASGTDPVPIALIASPVGGWLYKKEMFKIVVHLGRHGTQKIGFTGGQVFVWDPAQVLVKDAIAGTLDAGGKPVDAVWIEEALRAAGTTEE